jgi:glycosyltransferase involved in cell wall biosynthesis
MNRKIRLAWVSTHNSRCGLATHSEHLLEHFDRRVYDITIIANHAEPVKPDPADVVRLWPDHSGSLAAVREFIGRFDAVFVNFHFSLMGLHDLAEMLREARVAGIDTYLDLHKTLDTVIDGREVSLGEIADVLRGCTRLIVHTEADIARLKTFAIVDNVVMIPPGAIDQPALNAAIARRLLGLQQFQPIVGTFGFMLPPKGLPQLIHAFALVQRHFPEAMLLLLSAEYPGSVESAEERDRCRALIRGLGLEDRVRLIGDFLATEEVLLLLNACDVTVFAYQHSDESDSGAVRLGLAAGRPVATTPLPVFATLAEVVHQCAGRTAADIAAGILALLDDRDLSAAVWRRQRDWIGRNSWAAQAARIDDIIRGGFAERHAIAPRPPAPAPDRVQHAAWPHSNGSLGPQLLGSQLLRLAERVAAKLSRCELPPPPVAAISGPWRNGGLGVAELAAQWPEVCGAAIEWLPAMIAGRAGERCPDGICAKPGQPGHLVYGPYVELGAGDYRVCIRWDAGAPTRNVPRSQPVATIEAVSRCGKTYLAQRQLRVEDCLRPEHELIFRINGQPPPLLPIEIRVWTSGAVPVTLSSITVELIAAPAGMPGALAPVIDEATSLLMPEYRRPPPVLTARQSSPAPAGFPHRTAARMAAFDR